MNLSQDEILKLAKEYAQVTDMSLAHESVEKNIYMFPTNQHLLAFANAIQSHSGGEETYNDEREEIAAEHLDDIIVWLKARGLYDEIDYQHEGPDFPAILSIHENELINKEADQSARIKEQQTEITRLTAEVAELRKDAERKAMTLSDAFNLFQKHMQDDRGYAWSWHCNIAMNAVDAGANHIEANIRTGDFMRRCFGVDTKIFPEYKQIIDAAIKSEQKEREA